MITDPYDKMQSLDKEGTSYEVDISTLSETVHGPVISVGDEWVVMRDTSGRTVYVNRAHVMSVVIFEE